MPSINRPRYTKHQHAFAGQMTCGGCGNTNIREEEQKLADIRRDTALRESTSHDYAAKGRRF